jgi:thiamine-monophosphate kinase
VAGGPHGDAGAGLLLLQKGMKKGASYVRPLIKKHLQPEPRMADAARLAKSGLVTAMIDSSDGLAASVRLIAEQSGTGAVVDLERLPLSRELRRLAADDRSIDPRQLALNGGEDYELVFTVRPGTMERIQQIVPGATEIGRLAGGTKVEYHLNGKKKKIDTAGYHHFAA